MFGLSGTELLLVGLFAFIVFGPDKMPEIARTISKAINQFKRTQEDMERLLKAEMNRAIEEKQPVSTEETAKDPTVASSLYAEIEQEDEE